MDVVPSMEETEPPRTLASDEDAAPSEAQAPPDDALGLDDDDVDVGTEMLSLPEVCQLMSASHCTSMLDSLEEGCRWIIPPSRHARRWRYLQPR